MIREAIAKIVQGEDLTWEEAEKSMREIMEGEATQAQIASFLTALRMKGETVEEITSLAKTMKMYCRRLKPKVSSPLVDTCGTGGDRVKTFNISTVSAFVVAGAGVHVAKHGNRSVTSICGSADLLEALGLNLNTPAETVEESIEEIGIGFIYAPNFHPAMKHAVTPRREIGFRTVFNILGPLSNPADTEAQVIGVYDPSLTEPVAKVLGNLGLKQAMVVHGLDGLDEISTVGTTKISWLRDGEISTFTVEPERFEIRRAQPEMLQVRSLRESVEATIKILRGPCRIGDPKLDIVLLNAAAGIVVGEEAEDLEEGLKIAEESIDSGAAYEKLVALIEKSGGDPSKIGGLKDAT
ncbi:anthranilate phosphoribosyltransferase [Candidatus Bathyarchaeota archaeon]|nr:anthranilate phosphoribosyltransferase [Candidatus Bathyarchaeota archaeon]